MAENAILGENDGAGGPAQIRLSSGKTISVYPVSYRLHQTIDDRFRDPEVPTKEVKTIDGGIEKVPDPNNDEYKAELARVREGKAKAITRLVALQSLRHISVPEDNVWVEDVRLVDPQYEPPADPIDRKIDYLDYAYPFSPLDWQAVVGAAITSMVLDPREVERAMARFQHQVSGEAGKSFASAFAAANVLDDAGADADGEVGTHPLDPVSEPPLGGQSRARGRKAR